MITLETRAFDCFPPTVFALPYGFEVVSAEIAWDAESPHIPNALILYGETSNSPETLVPDAARIVRTGDEVPHAYVYHSNLGHDLHLYVRE